MVRIIGIASGKGGVGKSVTAANLGVALSTKFDKNVIVVDCNLTNPHLGLYLGGFSMWPVTLNSVLNRGVELEKSMYTHSSGLKIVPASFEPDDLKRLNMHRLRSRIRSAFDEYNADIIILDSSPGLAREAMLTLRCSDEVLFVSTPHIPSVVDITKCARALKDEDAKPMGIILNRVKGQKYELGEEEISQFTRMPIIAKIPEDDNVLKSTNFKMPVVLMAPKSRASHAFFGVAARIAGESYAPSAGLWKRIINMFAAR
jgi:septum site-determining protein MinD